MRIMSISEINSWNYRYVRLFDGKVIESIFRFLFLLNIPYEILNILTIQYILENTNFNFTFHLYKFIERKQFLSMCGSILCYVYKEGNSSGTQKVFGMYMLRILYSYKLFFISKLLIYFIKLLALLVMEMAINIYAMHGI